MWEKKAILAFCLAFPLECAKQAKKSQNISFFIFGYSFGFYIGDALRGIVLLELHSEFCREKMPLGKKLNLVLIKNQDPRLLADIK